MISKRVFLFYSTILEVTHVSLKHRFYDLIISYFVIKDIYCLQTPLLDNQDAFIQNRKLHFIEILDIYLTT